MQKKRKTLQELTIKDNFMFGAVMLEEENCREADNVKLGDGRTSIFLSTHGQNEDEEAEELVNFLKFVKADLQESTQDYNDDYVRKLQQTILRVKKSREMGVRYMAWHEMLREEWNDGRLEGRAEGRKEGRAEGRREDRMEAILELLEELGEIPEDLREKVEKQEDFSILKSWHRLAAKSDSIEQFMEQM